MYELDFQNGKVSVAVKHIEDPCLIPLFCLSIKYVWSAYYTGDTKSLQVPYVINVRRAKSFSTLIWIEKNKYLFVADDIMYVFELESEETVKSFYVRNDKAYIIVMRDKIPYHYCFLSQGRDKNDLKRNQPPSLCQNILRVPCICFTKTPPNPYKELWEREKRYGSSEYWTVYSKENYHLIPITRLTY